MKQVKIEGGYSKMYLHYPKKRYISFLKCLITLLAYRLKHFKIGSIFYRLQQAENALDGSTWFGTTLMPYLLSTCSFLSLSKI